MNIDKLTPKPNFDTAIKEINPNAEFSAENIDEIVWLNGTTEISKSDIENKLAELIADWNKKQYARDRAEAYPSIKTQLDDIYHNGIDGWRATIKAIKDANPKSEE
jgi:hypothetical protein